MDNVRQKCVCCGAKINDWEHLKLIFEQNPNSRHTKVSLQDRQDLIIIQCTDCGLAQYLTIYPKLDELYREDYRQKTEFDTPHRKQENALKCDLWVSKLLNHLVLEKQLPQKILDVGCAEGFFVEFLKEKGNDAMGLELNGLSVEYAKNRGLAVEQKDVKELSDTHHGTFDIVFNSGYIEHVLDPKTDLEKIYALLKDGGKVYLQTPNADCPNTAYVSDFFAPEHVQIFTPQALSNLVNSIGFTVKAIETGIYNDGFLLIAEKTGIKQNTRFKSSKNLNEIETEHQKLRTGQEFRAITKFLHDQKIVFGHGLPKKSNMEIMNDVAMGIHKMDIDSTKRLIANLVKTYLNNEKN